MTKTFLVIIALSLASCKGTIITKPISSEHQNDNIDKFSISSEHQNDNIDKFYQDKYEVIIALQQATYSSLHEVLSDKLSKESLMNVADYTSGVVDVFTRSPSKYKYALESHIISSSELNLVCDLKLLSYYHDQLAEVLSIVPRLNSKSMISEINKAINMYGNSFESELNKSVGYPEYDSSHFKMSKDQQVSKVYNDMMKIYKGHEIQPLYSVIKDANFSDCQSMNLAYCRKNLAVRLITTMSIIELRIKIYEETLLMANSVNYDGYSEFIAKTTGLIDAHKVKKDPKRKMALFNQYILSDELKVERLDSISASAQQITLNFHEQCLSWIAEECKVEALKECIKIEVPEIETSSLNNLENVSDAITSLQLTISTIGGAAAPSTMGWSAVVAVIADGTLELISVTIETYKEEDSLKKCAELKNGMVDIFTEQLKVNLQDGVEQKLRDSYSVYYDKKAVE